MIELIQLVGVCVIIYCVIVGMIVLVTKCSAEDAQKMIVSFLENKDYVLSRDTNYIQSVNNVVMDILGQSKYEELCDLNKYDMTLKIIDENNRLPCIHITLNYDDENEKKRLEAILERTTMQYLLNYKEPAYIKTLLEWSQNEILHLPMLIILYSRNEKEYKIIEEFEKSRIKKVSVKYDDILDDTEEINLNE